MCLTSRLCVKRESVPNVDAVMCHDGFCVQGCHSNVRGVIRQAELSSTATQASFGLLYCLLESLQRKPNLHPN